MKKYCVFIALFCITNSVYSQGDLDNALYIRLGYSRPSQKYGGVDDPNEWDVVKRNGISGEVGHIFILNSIPLADNLRLGINVDWLSGYYHSLVSDLSKERFFSLGSKVGPSLSYKPLDNLFLDAYFKVNPVWISALIESQEVVGVGEDHNFYLGAVGLGYSFGINVRYSLLIFGFDFNTSWNKLQHYDENSDEFDGTYFGNWSDTEKKRTPIPSYNFTIGVVF